MKKIFILVAFLFSFVACFGQYPITQNLGSANTLVQVPSNGGIRGGIINRYFNDTTAANATYLKDYPFAQIGTIDNKKWFRNFTATGWIEDGTGAGGGIHGVYTNYGLTKVDDSTLNFSTTLRDSIIGLIPAQFNPIQGYNILLTGSYPNITFTADSTIGNTRLATQGFVTRAIASGVTNISLKNQAWVDSTGNDLTGTVGNPGKPFRTINAALVALPHTTAQKIVHVGVGSFETFNRNVLYANTWIRGAKQPDFDVDITATSYNAITMTTPTKLVGGTIILGAVDSIDLDGIEITDLGIDLGSAYISGGGTVANCLGVGSFDATIPIRQISNIHFENLTLLGSTHTALFHSLVMENCYNAIVKNIKEMGNVHGYALKNIAGTFESLWGAWNSLDVYILKFDDYAPANDMVLNNFYATSLNETLKETGAGLIIQQASSGTDQGRLIINNGTIKSTGAGISGASGELNQIIISNININGSTNAGLSLTNLSNSTISNVNSFANGTYGFQITAAASGDNIISQNQANGNGSDGFILTGSASGNGKLYVFENVSKNNTGYGIRASGTRVYGNDNITTGNTAGTVTGVIFSTGTIFGISDRIPYFNINGNNTDASSLRFDGATLNVGSSNEFNINSATKVMTLGGVTPTTFASYRSIIDAGGANIFFGASTDFSFTSNGYYGGSGWRYYSTAPASNMFLYNGEVQLRVAGSGSSGAALTWNNALTIASSGSLNLSTVNSIGVDTTTYKPMVIDASGNVRKSFWVGGGSGLIIGTTAITSGTNTRILYNNSGVLGEYTTSGSGSVAMTTSPTFVTPTLGAATATTINGFAIQNAAADGTTKGLAAFNSTNLSASSGVVNTIQDIATTSTPTFGGMTITPGGGISTGILISGTTLASKLSLGGTVTPVTANGTLTIQDMAGTITEYPSGTHPLLAGLSITAPIITSGGATVTNTASLYVSDAPSATVTGANYALWVAAGGIRFGVLGSGIVNSDANGNLSVTSDGRLKNIQGDYNMGLKQIMQLNPITYKWKQGTGMETEHIYAGFDALQVYNVMGEYAAPTGRDGYHSLNDRAIIAALVNSVKDLKQQIDKLKK